MPFSPPMNFFSLRILLFCLGTIALQTGLSAQQQQNVGVCARVKIVIEQELTIERIGFEATLEVTNNDGEDPLTEFAAALRFYDPLEPEGSPARDVSDRFFVQPPVLESINRIDGAGVIGPTRKAVVRWFIIPKPDAGGTDPNGKVYLVDCIMGANIRGEPVPKDALFVVPETITVKPEPRLEIRYFQPRDVQANDPFTPEVEPPVPFTLGVLVSNTGYAVARQVMIRSQQPKIVENLQGLLLVARLLGVRVMDEPLNESSLTVNLGDIQPGGARKGVWEMITTLSGEFVDFKASYTHASELGGMETSLITLMEAHFIAAEVLNDELGRDRVLDFLADTDRDENHIPDALFESDGTILPVNHLQQVTVNPYIGPRTFTVDLEADFEGWGYMRVEDPGSANLKIESVVRSDGKVLSKPNAWTSYRYRKSDNYRMAFLHIFDRIEVEESYTYTVTYAAPVEDFDPPITRLRFAGEVTDNGGAFHITRNTQMFFTVEDVSPSATVYRLDNGEFRPALPFTIQEPGVYTLQFHSTDAEGNVEATRTATLILPAGGPSIADLNVEQTTLFLAGSTLSVRPREASLSLSVSDNPLPINADLQIYQGVKVHPVVSGLPVSPTPRSDIDLMVGGELVDFYRFRINNGAWSSERSIADPLPVRNTNEMVVLDLLSRSANGPYPSIEEALRLEWTVDPTATDWQISGLPPHTTHASSLHATVHGTGFDLFRWTINDGFYRAEAALGTAFSLSGLEEGEHTLAFIKPDGAGDWSIDAPDGTYTWTVDPAYGSDLSGLPLVLQRSFSNVEGSTVSFQWEGEDGQSTLLAPGWYTVLLTLSDPLGNITHTKRHLNIQQLSGDGEIVASAPTGPQSPHARGDWMVWQESGAGTMAIRAQPVRGESPGIALTNSSRNQERPQTDGRHVVWQGRAENGNWNIFLVDLDVPGVVQQLTSTPAINETNPVIDGNWVVWQERPVDGSSPWQLRAYNLDSAESFLVFPGPDEQLTPDLQAGRVVWRDMRHPGTGEIYFQDLETGATQRLTENLYAKIKPRIDGPWIVWQDNRFGQVEIFGYNLLRGAEEQLTFGPGNKANPFLVDGWLLFEEDSLFVNSVNFQLMDLDTGRIVPLTRSETSKTSGTIAGNHLIWRQMEGEGGVLRKAQLPALQTVFQNNNAVVITEGMAHGYGNAFSLLADWAHAAGVERLTRFTGAFPEMTEEVAFIEGGSPQGTNFILQPGEFLWVHFPESQVIELDIPDQTPVDLPGGLSALSYDRFPLGYSAAAFIRDLGPERVRAIRMLDSQSGFWKALEVNTDGSLLGPNFRIPPVAVVLLDLNEAIPAWEPYTP